MELEKLITICVPTFDRPHFLAEALISIQKQSYADIEVYIIDNNSTMFETNKSIVDHLKDRRFKYIKNNANIGIIENWNMAIKLTNSKYLCIFHDDDIMDIDFIKHSIQIHENHPSVGFSFTAANKVDVKLNHISRWGQNFIKPGFNTGLDYLLFTYAKGECISLAPSIVYKTEIFNIVGTFNDNLVYNTFDFNLFLRIAEFANVYFIDSPLIKYRIHDTQMSSEYWFAESNYKGKLAVKIEILDSIYRQILNKKLHTDRKELCDLSYENFNELIKYCRNLIDRL